MSIAYQAVGWNRQKKLYDAAIAVGVLLYSAGFIGFGTLKHPSVTIETLVIRALATAAFLLLHIILCIGPLARLDRRFLPLLYNRRHLGVAMFLLAFAHAGFSVFQFHALGAVNPLVSLLASNTRYASLADFPFETLGLAALAVLALMAATSHDFWLHVLTPAVWKRLHMLVYAAYALLIGHVSLGALQSDQSPWLVGALAVGMVVVVSLHWAAGGREQHIDDAAKRSNGPIDAGDWASLAEGSGRTVACASGRIAVFRHEGKPYAMSNRCRHQGGPLGEGRIVGGCVTCPWHGYQYRPEDGKAPAPFDDRIETYAVRVKQGRLVIDLDKAGGRDE